MTKITIYDILTEKEIERARALYDEYKDTGTLASKIASELIQPNLKRINQRIGQENDSLYLAYAVEYVLSQAQK